MVCLALQPSDSSNILLEAKRKCEINVSEPLDDFYKAYVSYNRERQLNISEAALQLKDFYTNIIDKYFKESQSGLTPKLSHHLMLKLEGVTACAIHFEQKKRYVHCYEETGVSIKGTLCVKKDTIQLLRDMERDIINIAVCGWSLCKEDQLRVQPINAIQPGNTIYIPHLGWKTVLNTEAKSITDSAVACIVYHDSGRCIQVSNQSRSDSLGNDEEKWARYIIVVEYIRHRLEALASGEYHILDLVERRTFGGYNHSLQGYDSVTATVNRCRESNGMQPAMIGSKIPFIRIKANSVTTDMYQDPLLVIREGHEINMKFYIGKIASALIGDENNLTTITSVMADSCGKYRVAACQQMGHMQSQVERILSSEVKGRPSLKYVITNVEEHPQWHEIRRNVFIKEIDIVSCRFRRMGVPNGYSLMGSMWNEGNTIIKHYYIGSGKMHQRETLNIALSICNYRN